MTLSLIIYNNYLDNLNYKQIAVILSLFGDSKISDDLSEVLNKTNLKNEYLYSNIIEYANQVNTKLSNSSREGPRPVLF